MQHTGGGTPKANAAMATPKYVWMFALLSTQVANVVGSLYLKLAMVTPTPPHPVVFALYREVLTGDLPPPSPAEAPGPRASLQNNIFAPVKCLPRSLML